jgi:hypothetical protein
MTIQSGFCAPGMSPSAGYSEVAHFLTCRITSTSAVSIAAFRNPGNHSGLLDMRQDIAAPRPWETGFTLMTGAPR